MGGRPGLVPSLPGQEVVLQILLNREVGQDTYV